MRTRYLAQGSGALLFTPAVQNFICLLRSYVKTRLQIVIKCSNKDFRNQAEGRMCKFFFKTTFSNLKQWTRKKYCTVLQGKVAGATFKNTQHASDYNSETRHNEQQYTSFKYKIKLEQGVFTPKITKPIDSFFTI